jgi:anti-sigma B factor antagonist
MKHKPPFTAELESDDSTHAQIWRLTGKMVGGDCCYEFLDTVRENVEKGQVNPVLELSRVPWANSTGVGVLASIYNAAHDAGGKLILVGATERVVSVLKVINLWIMVTHVDTLEEAQEHLGAS